MWLVTPFPEIAFPFESNASIVSFDDCVAGFITCTWFCRDGFTPVQYRIFLGANDDAGSTRISSSAYRGMFVAGKVAFGTAAPIGTSVTWIVGCALMAGTRSRLILNDSVTLPLLSTPE